MENEKNVIRIHRELENTRAQMTTLVTEYSQISRTHDAVQESLEREERDIRQVSWSLRLSNS